MRRVRNLVVVVCSAIAVWVLQVQVLGQFVRVPQILT